MQQLLPVLLLAKHGYKAGMTNTPTPDTGPMTTGSPGTRGSPSGLSSSAGERAALDLWTDLVRVTGTVHALLAERLAAELGMLPEEVDLLMRLEEAPEQRLRMVDVSRSLLLSKSGVTRLVDRLVERGLVERAACPSDRRVVYAGLTDEGRRAVTAAAPLLVAGVVEHLGRHLTGDELNAVRNSLRRILTAEGVDL
jgi:DNA-binding MarR family transcriptional regulator